jgi:hypothetical protein
MAMLNNQIVLLSGWWFGTWLLFSPIVGIICWDGGSTTN